MGRTSSMTGGTNSFQTTSEDVNKIRTNFFTDGPIGALTNTAGVAPMTGVWGVNAQGSPNMTIAVSSGDGLITATPSSQNSQRFNVSLDAQNATIPSNSSGSTVYNWIYVALSAALLSNPDVNGSTIASVVVTTSTSNSTDNSGSVPPYGNLIAIVTNANLATSITNANITDKRNQSTLSAASLLASALSLTGAVKQYTNAGSAGGTFNYVSLGGIKLLWGFTNIATVGGTGSPTSPISTTVALLLPASFFTNVQGAYPVINWNSTGGGSTSGAVGVYNTSTSTVNLLLTNTLGTALTFGAFVLVIGN